MSYLQSQTSAFFNEASSAASRLSHKRGLSPTPVSRTTTPRPAQPQYAAQTPIYSQAPITGTGQNLMTKVTMVTNWLRDTKGDRWVTFLDIADYLSLQHDEQARLTMEHILKNHSKIEYLPPSAPKVKPEVVKPEASIKPEPDTTPPSHQPTTRKEGLYRFRPHHNVRSSTDLLSLLQSKPDATGIPVKELRDGWPTCLSSIEDLSTSGLILCTRAKKDNAPKRVWPNDPSLLHDINPEFKEIWARLRVPPNKGDLRKELEGFGLTPTSVVKANRVERKVDGRKGRRNRPGAKVTNTHMAGVLKSFEHLRK